MVMLGLGGGGGGGGGGARPPPNHRPPLVAFLPFPSFPVADWPIGSRECLLGKPSRWLGGWGGMVEVCTVQFTLCSSKQRLHKINLVLV
jgi:hypothetical protein